MRRHKTHKRKVKKNRKTYRRKYGGTNNNNAQLQLELVAMIDRRDELINAIQAIINRAQEARVQPNANEMTFVDEIREFENEADEIDNYFGNMDMEDMLNHALEGVMRIFGLVNQNIQLLNNNNETIVYPKRKRIRSNNNINSDMSNINMLN